MLFSSSTNQRRSLLRMLTHIIFRIVLHFIFYLRLPFNDMICVIEWSGILLSSIRNPLCGPQHSNIHRRTLRTVQLIRCQCLWDSIWIFNLFLSFFFNFETEADLRIVVQNSNDKGCNVWRNNSLNAHTNAFWNIV